MIIIELMGGLGNQLQQYALYRKFISLGVDARLDTAWFDADVQENMRAKRKIEIDRFEGVSYEACTARDRADVIGRETLINRIKRKIAPASCNLYDERVIYDSELLGKRNLYLRGYWACEYYYADIIDELRSQLALPENPALASVVARILKENDGTCSITDVQADAGRGDAKSEGRSCSVHLRRGDYLEEDNMKIFGNICTDAYYDAALELAVKNGTGRFFIFSEDEEYARSFAEMIREKYQKASEYINVNKGDDSCYDIYLMSLCDINICANSTFSFWGARLNSNPDKLMIRPTKQKNSQIFDENEMKKLWKGWTFIDPEGKIY